MKQSVEELALLLTFLELQHLQPGSMTDKDRDFLVKALTATKQDVTNIVNTGLAMMSDAELEDLLGGNLKPTDHQ